MALAEWERTTDTNTKQFVAFMTFLVENGMADEVVKHLEGKGLDKIRVSVQHIREAQDLIRRKHAAGGPAGTEPTILSAHVDGKCT